MQSTDFLIITALAAEFAAVAGKLSDIEDIPDKETGSVFCKSTLPISNGIDTRSHYDIILVRLHSMGNISAAITTVEAIQKWQPSQVILVGITAGMSGKVNLGDIIVADRVVSYEVGKSLDRGYADRIEPFTVSRKLISAIQHYGYGDNSWRELLSYPELRQRVLQVRFGSVLSGSKLLALGNTFEHLQNSNPDLIAVDMEASGIAGVTSQLAYDAPEFLAIRSVSDFADSSRCDEFVHYACDIAASYTIDFLRAGLVPTRKEMEISAEATISLGLEPDKITSPELVSALSKFLQIDRTRIKVQGPSDES